MEAEESRWELTFVQAGCFAVMTKVKMLPDFQGEQKMNLHVMVVK